MDDRSCQPSEDMLRSLEVEGWEEWLARLDKRLERPVSICGECRMAKGSKVFFIPCFFIPCFFMPPEKTIALPYVDGTFAWNNAWGASLIDSADTCRPIKNHTINLVEDAIFLDSVCSLVFSLRALSHDATKAKPYMAAVSPLFFTLRYHRTMGFQQVRSDPCARLTT